MTNQSQVSEVERVDAIHAHLIRLHGEPERFETYLLCDLNGVDHRYTRAELEDFVALLPDMRRRITGGAYTTAWSVPARQPHGCWAGRGDPHGGGVVWRDGEEVGTTTLADRGLYLTREHALYREGDASKLKQCRRCTIENDGHHVTLNVDGLCGHCVCDIANGCSEQVANVPAVNTKPVAPVVHGSLTEAEIAALTAEHDAKPNPKDPRGLSRRARLEAQLLAELDRPLKKPSKHDPRPIDLDQAWSRPGWES